MVQNKKKTTVKFLLGDDLNIETKEIQDIMAVSLKVQKAKEATGSRYTIWFLRMDSKILM